MAERLTALENLAVYCGPPYNLSDTTSSKVWNAVQKHCPRLRLHVDIARVTHPYPNARDTLGNIIPGMPLFNLVFRVKDYPSLKEVTPELFRLLTEQLSGNLAFLLIIAGRRWGECWPVGALLVKLVKKALKLRNMSLYNIKLSSSSAVEIYNECHLVKDSSRLLELQVDRIENNCPTDLFKNLPDRPTKITWDKQGLRVSHFDCEIAVTNL